MFNWRLDDGSLDTSNVVTAIVLTFAGLFMAALVAIPVSQWRDGSGDLSADVEAVEVPARAMRLDFADSINFDESHDAPGFYYITQDIRVLMYEPSESEAHLVAAAWVDHRWVCRSIARRFDDRQKADFFEAGFHSVGFPGSVRCGLNISSVHSRGE